MWTLSDKTFWINASLLSSLQRELSTAKGEKLEERCNQLQKEYQQLQQQLWQRKRQHRQQQLKQQYQGKQQYTHPVSQNKVVKNNNRTASQVCTYFKQDPKL